MTSTDQTHLVRLPLSIVCRDCFEDYTTEQRGCGNGAGWHYREGGDGWTERYFARLLMPDEDI